MPAEQNARHRVAKEYEDWTDPIGVWDERLDLHRRGGQAIRERERTVQMFDFLSKGRCRTFVPIPCSISLACREFNRAIATGSDETKNPPA